MANGMNRPGVTINWVSQNTKTNVIADTIIRPLYLQLFSSDKGPENLRTVHGDEFFKLYGNTPSFKKHGQPLLQAASIISAGGELLCKRVVAEDATLANFVVVAKVVKETVQKVNAAGLPLYIDAETGKETTESAGGLNEKAVINAANIKYDAVSIKGAKTLTEVMAHASALVKDELEVDEEGYTSYDQTTKVGDPLTDKNLVGQVVDSDDPDFGKYVYPLFVVVDNGRGVSSKRFRITPDYTISKSLGFGMYKLNFIGENESENEYVWFSFRDDVVYLDKNMSLNMVGKDLVQIKAGSFEDSINLFTKRISNITGIEEDELKSLDVIFGADRKGEKIPQIVINEEEGYKLDSTLGMMLSEGDNGAFGDTPLTSAAYSEELIKVINGEYDDSIFDKDRFMIDVCVDANYPVEIKNALFNLAQFRQDFVFLCDYGTGLTSYDSIIAKDADFSESKFVGNYPQSWDIIDPYTKKQITVTATYSIAPKLVSHLNDRRHAPLCGSIYDFTFPEVIEGTVSFLPKVTPSADQKTLMADARLNYASYLNGVLTMETCFTSANTTVEDNLNKYINNIFAVIKLIHNIRTECPKLRFTEITTDTDLERYRDKINAVIMRSNTDFKEVRMEYVQDDIMRANHVFEANIFVRHSDFEQEEVFNIYTLGYN